jgi:hypothetical protein
LTAEIKLSRAEEQAIADLRRLAKHWPKSLWLFSASGSLLVMKCGPDGQRVHKGEAFDGRNEVAHITGIPNDGGDF